MNDQFKAQKEILVSLKHEISLLHQQVDYLIRNEKSLGLLDLDVMMNRTHTIYDQLCSINVGNPPSDNEEVDINPEMLNALFGMDDGEDEEEYYEDPDEEVETPAQDTEEREVKEVKDGSEENVDFEKDIVIEDQDDDIVIEDQDEDVVIENQENDIVIEDQEEDDVIVEEPVKADEPTPSEEQDYGFIFKMEPDEPEQTIEPEQTDEPIEPKEPELFSEPEQAELFIEPEQPELSPEEKKNGFYTSGDEIEMEIPHFDFPTTEEDEAITPEEKESGSMGEESDFIDEKEPRLFEETEPLEETELSEETEPFEEVHILEEEELEPQEENLEEEPEEPEETEEPEEPASSDDIAYEPIIFGDMEEKDDMGFEATNYNTKTTTRWLPCFKTKPHATCVPP